MVSCEVGGREVEWRIWWSWLVRSEIWLAWNVAMVGSSGMNLFL